MKKLGIIIFVATLFLSCAKANDPYKDTNYSIEHIFSTIGEPVDFSIGPNKLFVAEDRGGFSIYDKSTGEKYFNGTEVYSKNDSMHIEPTFLNHVKFIKYSRNSNYLFVYNIDETDTNSIYILDLTDQSIPIYKAIADGNPLNIKDIFFYNTPLPGYQDRFAIVNPKFPETDGTETSFRLSDFFSYHPSTGLPGSVEHDSLIFFTDIKGLDIVDNLAYFATSQTGIKVYDISGENAVLAGSVDTPGEAIKLKVVGNYIYVADKQTGLQVIDKSNLSNMKIVYSYDTAGYAESIAIEGNLLAVGSGGGGVYVFDISSPAQPKLLTNIPTDVLGYVNKVLIDDGFVYVASRDKGIVKIKI